MTEDHLAVRTVWITGIYEPTTPSEDGDWISFAYGPFPSTKVATDVANSLMAMTIAIGKDLMLDYEIDVVGHLWYNQACKHFEETIQSRYFDDWYMAPDGPGNFTAYREAS